MTIIDIINSFLNYVTQSDEITEYFQNVDNIDFKLRYIENTPNGEQLIHTVLYDNKTAWYVIIIIRDGELLSYEFVEKVLDPGLHLFP